MQLWDIGGQSIGSKMISNYIHGAHAVLLCYDITNSESFQNLEDWHMVVRRACSSSNSEDGNNVSQTAMPFMALVGNKCDLSHMRAVRTERAHVFADENNMHMFFMSAKSGDQVNACFHRLAAQLAGIKMSKAELQMLDGASNVVTAAIINHERHDPEVNGGEVPVYTKAGRSCCIS
eukprot:13098-Heterococcus_DN1.PRE.5